MLFILLPLLTVASHSSSCPGQERVSLQCVGKEPPSVPVSQAPAQQLHPTRTVNKPPLRLQFLLQCCRANWKEGYGREKTTEGRAYHVEAGTGRPQAVECNLPQSFRSQRAVMPLGADNTLEMITGIWRTTVPCPQLFCWRWNNGLVFFFFQ